MQLTERMKMLWIKEKVYSGQNDFFVIYNNTISTLYFFFTSFQWYRVCITVLQTGMA